jgi:alpha-L-fucosidase
MKYMVLTTKHHEGFCLWDSKLTDYTVMNAPYGKDIVASYVEGVRAAGLKVGFYPFAAGLAPSRLPHRWASSATRRPRRRGAERRP